MNPDRPRVGGSPAKPADFDSATAMTAATARMLRGKDFPVLGKSFGGGLRPLLVALNQLPTPARRWLYRVGSGREAMRPEVVAGAESEHLAEQVVGRFPKGPFPGAIVGSTPGSAVHLAAALGVPMLPQTLLLPLGHDPIVLDDPQREVEVARPVAEALLERNPHLAVHHMSDPSNDRLTLARFSYFRVKRTALGATYERFLTERVEEGGTIYLVESQHMWPTTEISERYYFQFGGVGGLSPDEYLNGGERVARFLEREGSDKRRWSPPKADGMRPEAEWGFDRELGEDVGRFARQNGFRVVRLCFDQADDLSAFVAELYRWWYERLGRPSNRLFVESFVLLDPYWVLRSGSVPYWLTFNAEPGMKRLDRYLDTAQPFDDIDVTLVSNGTWTPGLAGPSDWESIFERARRRGRLAGVDPRRFPTDLAVFARYRDTLRRARPRHSIPEPLLATEFELFAKEDGRHGVTIA